MHYYKRNIGDYAKKCGRLTMLQHGAYTLLIDSCYDREVFPTLEQALDWTWASTEAEVEAVKFILNRFFTVDQDGRYIQNRIAQELSEYHEKANINKRIALEREAKRRENSTNRARTVHEPTPNHEPITNNHKPLLEENIYVQEDVKNSTNKIANCEYQKVIDVYHECLPELSKARLLTKARERLIKQRWNWILTSKKPDGERRATNAQEALVWFENYFNRVRDNDFLMGRVKQSNDHKNWKCDIDFLMEDRGLKHVIEKTEG